MKKTIGLFDRAIRKGAEIFLMHEELDDIVEQERRLSICESNESVCYDAEKDKCKNCKCYMSVKVGMLKHINPTAKGRIEITHCPLAKWGQDLLDKNLTEINEEIQIANYYREIDGKELIINQ